MLRILDAAVAVMLAAGSVALTPAPDENRGQSAERPKIEGENKGSSAGAQTARRGPATECAIA